jgi:hypothetical protein
MKPIPRRKFIKGTAIAGGALFLLPELEASMLLKSDAGTNYFLKEFVLMIFFKSYLQKRFREVICGPVL